MKVNLFDDTLLSNVVDSVASKITVNELHNDKFEIDGIVTNANLNNISSRHIHSKHEIKRGQYIKLENSFYMITSDVISKRGNKYKAIVEYCNYILEPYHSEKVNTGQVDNLGKPIYQNVKVQNHLEPSILKYKDMTLDDDALVIASKTLIALVQDNIKNRTDLQINNTVEIHGRSYKVMNVEMTKIGLLEVRLTTEDVIVVVE